MKQLLAILLLAAVSCSCSRPIVRYKEYDPDKPYIMGAWYKADGSYWFTTPSVELAKAEYARVTGHQPTRIPCNMYGFYVWGDGSGMFYVTQQRNDK